MFDQDTKENVSHFEHEAMREIFELKSQNAELLAALEECLAHIEWRMAIAREKEGANHLTHRARATIARAKGENHG
jgi:hypothetical protein